MMYRVQIAAVPALKIVWNIDQRFSQYQPILILNYDTKNMNNRSAGNTVMHQTSNTY